MVAIPLAALAASSPDQSGAPGASLANSVRAPSMVKNSVTALSIAAAAQAITSAEWTRP